MAKKAKQKKPRRGAKKITAKAKSTGKKAGLKRKAARKPARSQAARSRDTGCAGQPKRPDGAVEASRADGGCGSGRRGLRRSFRG